MKRLSVIALLVFLSTVAACGKKGDLTLPPKQEAAALSAGALAAAA